MTSCYSNPPTPEGLGQYIPAYHTTKFLSSLISYPLAYEDGTDSVPKRRLSNTIRRRTTQKFTHDIQNTAKAWNQELLVS
jgi:hypothetical protein